MVATSCRQWTQVNVRQTYGICVITIVNRKWTCVQNLVFEHVQNLPVISLVAEKWQVMASEHTSTMWSPCDNHAITSRAEVVANWPHVNARQSHDKRATIFATLVSLSSELMPSNSRPEYALHAHVEHFAPPLFENPGSSPASLPVTCTLLSTPCSQIMANSSAHAVNVKMQRLTLQVVGLQVVLQPPCFSAEATFVMYWNECMFLLLEPIVISHFIHLLLSVWFLLLVSTLHTLIVARSGKLRQALRSWKTTYC